MAIVGLLSMSVIASLLTVFAARSDGGAQVIDDYYHKAATWDSTRTAQAASDALEWKIEFPCEPADSTTRIVRLRVQTQQGEPMSGLQGTMNAFRPQHAPRVDQTALVEKEPGVYEQPLAVQESGLWDFEIAATRDGTPFLKRIRLEVER